MKKWIVLLALGIPAFMSMSYAMGQRPQNGGPDRSTDAGNNGVTDLNAQINNEAGMNTNAAGTTTSMSGNTSTNAGVPISSTSNSAESRSASGSNTH